MSKITQEIILSKLAKIKTADKKKKLISSNELSSITIKDNDVSFIIEVINKEDLQSYQKIKEKCEKLISKIDGVEKVTGIITLENNQQRNIQPNTKPTINSPAFANIKQVIAVASGKGGVGKSTISVSIALALARTGKKIGIIDADIYGPSIAKMMGTNNEPEFENQKIIPPIAFGVKCASMGMLLQDDSAAIWRAPMAIKALNQLINGTNWGELDYLIIDMPPGTGDIQLSIASKFKPDGAVIISTPQEVALLDAQKAITMFQKVEVPIIGIIENMSYFKDESGNKNYIFGKGNTENIAKEFNISLMAKIPLLNEISAQLDKGNADNALAEISEIMDDICKEL